MHTVTNSGDAVGHGSLSTTEKIIVSVPQKFTLGGSIARGGSGLSGVYVSLKRDGHTRASVKTDESGNFSFKNVLPGVYTIRAYKYKTSFSGLPDSLTVNADTTVGFTAQ